MALRPALLIAFGLLCGCHGGAPTPPPGPPSARPPEAPAIAEAEPNDRSANANPLPLGVPVTGRISKEDDVDVWRLDLPAPRPGETGKRALGLEVSAVPGLRPALAVVDAEGAPVAERRAREVGAEVSLPNLTLAPDARLPLYVTVKSAWIGKRRTAAPDTPYRLRATLATVPADLEEEPNDGPETATPIVGLGRLGYLTPTGDADWYSVTVDRPVIARVVVSGVDGVDLVLDAPDPSAGKDAVRARSNVGGEKDGEILPDLWLPAGTSYLRVASGSRKVDGKWVRDYENPGQTYTLGVSMRDAFPGDEVEPNDTPERATPLRVGGRGRGYLYPYRDVDFFRVEIGPEDEGTLTAVASALPHVDVTLSLHGGEPVEGVQPVIASAGVDKATGEARLTAEVEPGVYLLEVRDAKGTGANAGDPYRLDVRVTFE